MSRRREGGFTLVELMVVLAIMAIMAGIAVPNLLAYVPGARASGAARQIVSDLRLARTLAVDTGVNTVVTFYPSSMRYIVSRDTDGNNAYTSGEAIDRDVTLTGDFKGLQFGTNAAANPSGTGSPPSGGVDFGGGTAVVFHTNGSASADGEVYVMPAADAGGRTDRNRAVTVTAPTGNIRIWVHEGTGWK